MTEAEESGALDGAAGAAAIEPADAAGPTGCVPGGARIESGTGVAATPGITVGVLSGTALGAGAGAAAAAGCGADGAAGGAGGAAASRTSMFGWATCRYT